MQRNADIRVLRSQLDVAAGVGRSVWYTTPLWALVLAWLGSAACGFFGTQHLAIALFFPAVVGCVSFAVYRLYGIYRADRDADAAQLRRWMGRFVGAQIAISAAWGLFPWLLWTDGNLRNHLFILLAVATTLASLMISRTSNMVMFAAGMLPIVGLTALRFTVAGLEGDGWLDFIFALLTPAYALHLYVDGRRIIFRLQEDARLRFNVEDLAAALIAARDEAVRKRYEAETANASKTAFLANMSHELRTPLNAILGFSDIIAHQSMGGDQLDRYSDYARDIHGSGTHLLSLINDLLDVAKIEAGKMEIDPRLLDPRPTIESAGRLIAPRASEKGVDIALQIAADAPSIIADERALKQMLLNLLSNAVKFTPAGGHVTLACTTSQKGGLQICVSDDGPGIAAEKLERVFEPFSQIDNRYDREAGGTGLGLALVQGLARLHGGRAWIDSAEGVGVRAYIYLPASMTTQDGRLRA